MMYGGVSLGGMHMTGGARSKHPKLDKEIIQQYLDPNMTEYELTDPIAEKMSDAVLAKYIENVIEKYEAKKNEVKAPRAPRTRVPKAPKAPKASKAPRVRVPRDPRVRAILTAEQKAIRNEKERERRRQKKYQLIKRLESGHATINDKNLLLGTRIFGKAERKGLFNNEHNKKMTQQDKVDLSNWLANHWEFEDPPRGYGAGMYSESDSDDDELIAGGKMIKHKAPKRRTTRMSKRRTTRMPKRRGGVEMGGSDMELMAGGKMIKHKAPRRHRGGVEMGGESMADALRAEYMFGKPRVVGNRNLYQSGEPVHGGVALGGARRRVGRPRKHSTKGGFDFGSLLESAVPIALSLL